MRDRLRKYRKDDYVEKRFGKDINVSTKDEAPVRKSMTEAETKSVSEAKPGGAKPMAGRSSFGAAFRAARKAAIDAGRDPDKEVFTWGGEKKIARLATDSKPAAPRAGAGRASGTGTPKDNKPSPEGLRALRQLMDKPINLKREALNPPTTVVKRSPINAGRSEGFLAQLGTGKIGKAFEERQKKKYGYAKGGKIDGIAIRGKTKIGRK